MSSPAARGTATVTITFAAAIALVAGITNLLQGIAALFGGDDFLIGTKYMYGFNSTVWGWGHIVLGAAMSILAVCLVLRKEWARLAATVVAIMIIITNFMWLLRSPAWGIVIIGFSVLLIWALSTRKSDADTPWDV
jgi:hypothetical protein